MKQQRTSAVRRVRPNLAGVQYGSIDWQMAGFADDYMELQLFGGDGQQITDFAGFRIVEPPQILVAGIAETPISYSFAGTNLRLNYASNLPDGFSCSLPQSSRSMRGSFGEFLNAKTLIVAAHPVPETDSIALQAFAEGASAFVQIDGGTADLWMHHLPAIENLENSEMATRVSVDVDGVRAYFPTAVMAGWSIHYTREVGVFRNITGGTVATFTFVLQ